MPIVGRGDRPLERIARRIVFRIAIAKTLRENLVENRLGRPGGLRLEGIERDAFVFGKRCRPLRARGRKTERDAAKAREKKNALTHGGMSDNSAEARASGQTLSPRSSLVGTQR